MFLKNKLTKASIDILPELNSYSDFKTIDQSYQKILRDLLVILSTLKGSILYQPNYGGNLYGFLWDALTHTVLNEIKELIDQSLSYSPYLTVKSINVTQSKTNVKTAIIEIKIVVDEETILKVNLNLSPLGDIEINDAEKIISKFIVKQ